MKVRRVRDRLVADGPVSAYRFQQNVCFIHRLLLNPTSMTDILLHALKTVLQRFYPGSMTHGAAYYIELGCSLKDPFLICFSMATILSAVPLLRQTWQRQMHRQAKHYCQPYFFNQIYRLLMHPYDYDNVDSLATSWLKQTAFPFQSGQYDLVKYARHPRQTTFEVYDFLQSVGLENQLCSDSEDEVVEEPTTSKLSSEGLTLKDLRQTPEAARARVSHRDFAQMVRLGFHQDVADVTNVDAQKKSENKKRLRAKQVKETQIYQDVDVAKPISSDLMDGVEKTSSVDHLFEFQESDDELPDAVPAKKSTPALAATTKVVPSTIATNFVENLLDSDSDTDLP